MKNNKKYYVYEVTFKEDIVYIGRSINYERRLQEHHSNIKSTNEKYKNHKFYNEIRKENGSFYLSNLKEFKTLVESKRYEMYMILDRYFKDKVLYQKIPNIRDF